MHNLLFFAFSLIMIAFGLGVVVSRNPVSSAMCLVASFIGLAVLFVMLDAFFIGLIQILVYTGAVMVLFLFIIMLMDIRSEKSRTFPLAAIGGGGIIALIVAAQIAMVSGTIVGGSDPLPALDLQAAAEARVESGTGTADDSITTALTNPERPSYPDIRLIGESLFTRYWLHIQIVAVLLTVATVGVVVLSKRRLI